jgi:hypothetical protein
MEATELKEKRFKSGLNNNCINSKSKASFILKKQRRSKTRKK